MTEHSIRFGTFFAFKDFCINIFMYLPIYMMLYCLPLSTGILYSVI